MTEGFIRAASLRGAAQSGRIEQMTLEKAKDVLANDLLKGYQGTVLCVHTLSALKKISVHMALIRAQMDYAIGSLDDIRVFNTMVMAPAWDKITSTPRSIVALDGFLSEGERELVLRRFPQARVIEVADVAHPNAEMAKRLLPGDAQMRELYRALRRLEKAEYSLTLLAAETNLSEESILCAMRVFEELNLISMGVNPFVYRLLPSGKVSLENSRLRSEMMRLYQIKD